MKLLNKTIRRYFIYTLPVFLIVTYLISFVVVKVNNDHLDKMLHFEKDRIVKFMEKADTLYPHYTDLVENYIVEEIDSQGRYFEEFSDIVVYDSINDLSESFRLLECQFEVKNRDYIAKIRTSTIKSTQLVYITLSLIVLLLILVYVIYLLINRFMLKHMWSGFYATLDHLLSFRLAENSEIKLVETDVYEFQQLNTVLEKMIDSIRNDYQRQKMFIDNVSHEIQTPLSIIQGNLENLMQSPNLAESELNYIQQIDDTVSRLSKINKSLILLSRINNDQFPFTESILLNHLINNAIIRFEDQIESKKIVLKMELEEVLQVNINPTIAEILVHNLIQNAVRHNVTEGTISISISTNRLVISNTGNPLKDAPEAMFNRFARNSEAGDSIGLGLAIVKQICDNYAIILTYKNEDNQHEICLRFN